jgi:hypothetical protein
MDSNAALVSAKDVLEKASRESFAELTGLELKALGLPKKPVSGIRIITDFLVAVESDETNSEYETRQVVFSFKDTDWAVDYVAPPGMSKRKMEPWDDDVESIVSRIKLTIAPIDTDEVQHDPKPRKTSASRRKRPKTKSTVAAGLASAA